MRVRGGRRAGDTGNPEGARSYRRVANSDYADIVARSRVPLVEAQVDAIVNAANNDLVGGGVCGAIFRAAGPELVAACRALGGCLTGEVELTPGFKLSAKLIIHAVGPKAAERPDLLASSYRQALQSATRRGLRSIAFTCIITGIYGFDPALAADIAMKTVKEWLEKPAKWSCMDRIIFVMHTAQDEALYAERWPTYFPPRRAPAYVRAVTATAPAPAAVAAWPRQQSTWLHVGQASHAADRAAYHHRENSISARRRGLSSDRHLHQFRRYPTLRRRSGQRRWPRHGPLGSRRRAQEYRRRHRR
jgi:O-acetyl-ADP-ribose deacetylase (regulator of RNase III)